MRKSISDSRKPFARLSPADHDKHNAEVKFLQDAGLLRYASDDAKQADSERATVARTEDDDHDENTP